MSNSTGYNVLDIEHIVGVIIGILPLIAIWVIFRNNDVQYIAWLKHCASLAGGVSVFIAFTEIFIKCFLLNNL